MAEKPEATAEIRSRIFGITDGIFAIALTLIVLEIRIPLPGGITSEGALLGAIVALAPRLLTYALSFLTLTIFWFGQQAQHELLAGSDRRLATLNLLFLAFIALLPFSTDLLAEFLTLKIAIAIYWLNLLLLGLTLFLSWDYAVKQHLLASDVSGETVTNVYRRIVKAQILWAIAAALCLLDTRLSIGLFLLVQIIYVVAPRNPRWRMLIG